MKLPYGDEMSPFPRQTKTQTEAEMTPCGPRAVNRDSRTWPRNRTGPLSCISTRSRDRGLVLTIRTRMGAHQSDMPGAQLDGRWWAAMLRAGGRRRRRTAPIDGADLGDEPVPAVASIPTPLWAPTTGVHGRARLRVSDLNCERVMSQSVAGSEGGPVSGVDDAYGAVHASRGIVFILL